MDRQTVKETDSWMDRQTDKWMDRWSDREADEQTERERLDRMTGGQLNSWRN
jgi:hypothetical protein